MQNIDKAVLQEINEIRKKMQCSKGFICIESGFTKLCKARDIGLQRHLRCLEYTHSLCDFALLYEKNYYCGCPLRVYLAKALQMNMSKIK